MNAYKTATASGIDKALDASIEEDLEGKGGLPPSNGLSLGEFEALNPELGKLARETWGRLAK